jgi:hypothetical protein
MGGEPRYALFGGVNKRSPGEDPYATQLIATYLTSWEAQDRAAYGNRHGVRLRWYAVVDLDVGEVVAREDW